MYAARKSGRKQTRSRRTHRKSRLGCANCRRRRVKCDEDKPSCNNCIKHGVQCDFITAPPSVSTPSPSASPLGPGTSALGLNVIELELLHHYVTTTCETFSGDSIMQTLFRTHAPEIGFSHHFVLHFLFSASAFHLARLRPEARDFYMELAEGYHDTALQTAAALLPYLSADNCEALYLSATFVSVLTFARGPSPGDYLVFTEHGTSDWLVLYHGVRSIIELQSENLFSGKLAALFQIAGKRLFTKTMEGPAPEVNEHVRTLRQHIIGLAAEDPNTPMYLEAFEDLCRYLAIIYESHGDRRNFSLIAFAWIYRLSDDFILCLQQHQPAALVVLAYFVVLLNSISYDWHMEGWPDHLMSGIYSFLPEEYKRWIKWPAEQIGWTVL